MINLSKKRNHKNEKNVLPFTFIEKRTKFQYIMEWKIEQIFLRVTNPLWEINSIIKIYISENSINKYRQVDSNKNK